MSAPLALAALVLLAICARAASVPPHARHIRHAHPIPSVQIGEAEYKTLCEFEILKDENEDRVPRVMQQMVCVPPERRQSKTCCNGHRHECVQLLDSIYVQVNGRDHRMHQRVGCACMSTEFITSSPMALPSPG